MLPTQLGSGMLFPCLTLRSGELHFFWTEPRLQPTSLIGGVLNAVDCLLTHDPEKRFRSLVQRSSDAHDVYGVALCSLGDIFVGEANMAYFIGKLRLIQIGQIGIPFLARLLNFRFDRVDSFGFK